MQPILGISRPSLNMNKVYKGKVYMVYRTKIEIPRQPEKKEILGIENLTPGLYECVNGVYPKERIIFVIDTPLFDHTDDSWKNVFCVCGDEVVTPATLLWEKAKFIELPKGTSFTIHN